MILGVPLIFCALASTTFDDDPPSPPPSPEVVESANTILEQFLIDHDSETAINNLNRLIAQHPDDPEPRLCFARLLAARGDFDLSIRQIEAIEGGSSGEAAKRLAGEVRQRVDSMRQHAGTQSALKEDGSSIGTTTLNVLIERLVADARALRQIGPAALANMSTHQDPSQTSDETMRDNSLDEYARYMDEGFTQIRKGSFERAETAFMTAQMHNAEAIEPTIQLFLIAANQNSAEIAKRAITMARGRFTIVFEQLFAKPEARWLLENTEFVAALASEASVQENEVLQNASRLVRLIRMTSGIQDPKTRAALELKLRDSIRTPILKRLAATLGIRE